MRTNSQSTTSQLPRVLLQVNPGLTRQLSTKLAVMDKLREKNSRAADYGRRRFMEELERRSPCLSTNRAASSRPPASSEDGAR